MASRNGIEVNVEDYQRLSRSLRGADPLIKKEFTKALRDIGRPFGRFVLVAAGSQLPQRGGLGYRVASARVTVTVSTMRATVNLKSKEGYDFKQMDTGWLHHPVFAKAHGERTLRSHAAQARIASGVSNAADAWTWVKQRIRPNVFTDPFEQGAPMIRAEMLEAGQRVLRQLGV